MGEGADRIGHGTGATAVAPDHEEALGRFCAQG